MPSAFPVEPCRPWRQVRGRKSDARGAGDRGGWKDTYWMGSGTLRGIRRAPFSGHKPRPAPSAPITPGDNEPEPGALQSDRATPRGDCISLAHGASVRLLRVCLSARDQRKWPPPPVPWLSIPFLTNAVNSHQRDSRMSIQREFPSLGMTCQVYLNVRGSGLQIQASLSLMLF